MVTYGFCPYTGCPLSYENERAIIGWYSARNLPGSSGTGPGEDRLPSELRRVFQDWGARIEVL